MKHAVLQRGHGGLMADSNSTLILGYLPSRVSHFICT